MNGGLMALAEARAIWQRTANRCLVQEDAKRAPKLACCSSVAPSTKQVDTGHATAVGGHGIPKTGPLLNPSHFNLCPKSQWWVQMHPNYGYQKVDDQYNSVEGHIEACQVQECLGDLSKKENDGGFTDQTTFNNSSCNSWCKDFRDGGQKDSGVKEEYFSQFSTSNFQDPFKQEFKDDSEGLKIEGLEGWEVLKKSNDGLDPGSSWIGAEKNTPWWRTADAEELALLVAQSSLNFVENCDLPHPQNPHVRKDVDVNVCYFCQVGVSSSVPDPKLGYSSYMPRRPTAGRACRKHCVPAEDRLTYFSEKPLRDVPAPERTPDMNTFETDASTAKLLEALCHSQTRAREAEGAAKRACTEKEHIIKLVLKQASQLFAYKQWLRLLQLENMYVQLNKDNSQTLSFALSIPLPWTPHRTWKMQKSCQKSSSSRTQAKQSCHSIGKYAAVFALGLGLVGTGFLLGWTVGQMLPTW